MYFYLVLAVTIILVALNWAAIRSRIYDILIVSMTAAWYKTVIDKLEPGSLVLDVGIGTGSALAKNSGLVRKKGIKVRGLDYDLDYVNTCKQVLIDHKLDKLCSVIHASVYDFDETGFDAAYFSGSLMIMPDPVKALTHVHSLLKPGGKIYITQTFEQNRNAILEKIKPLLKYLLTIDFGQITYEKDFLKTAKEAGMAIIHQQTISSTYSRISKLQVLEK